jgi:hypothetical protein
MRHITYGIEEETGLVYSRVGSEVAVPVLDFEAIGQGGNGYAPGDFRGPTRYTLEKCPVYQVGYSGIRWTRNIPVEAKNHHRRYWGFPPAMARPDEWTLEFRQPPRRR